MAYYPTKEEESTSTYYIQNQSIHSTRKAHKLINVITREKEWASEKWRTINILDDLRLKFNRNASLIDNFFSQYPSLLFKNTANKTTSNINKIKKSDFQQLIGSTC